MWSVTALRSSTNTPVYPGDVIFIDTTSPFWYNRVLFASKVPDQVASLWFMIFYEKTPSTMSSLISEHVLTKTFFFPQGLLIANSQHNYLLKDSRMYFNFSIDNPSKFAMYAKICQFSKLADYERIIDSETNQTIADAEKKGDCQKIIESPNMFQIEVSGYYWYVLSTPLSPDDENVNVRTSYKYNLTKVSYDLKGLKTSQNCSFLNGAESECTVANSVFLQHSTKYILALLSIPDSAGPYTITITNNIAVGIALLAFIILLSTFIILILIVICVLYKFKNKLFH